jgi:multidrug efflux system outer membrane protein
MLSATLAACVSSRDIVIPTPEQDAQESQLDALGNSKISADAPVSAWWETLDDTQLSALINLALEKNKDVKIAIASLAEARGIAREAGADRLPNFNTSVSGQRVRSSEALGIVPGDRTSDVYDAGFDAAWELDLFGRVASGIEASDARQRAALDALRNVYVTIAAEVARTYAEYRGAQYRLRIAKRNSANQKETYDIAVSLSEAGRSSRLDVTRAFTQLELTLST